MNCFPKETYFNQLIPLNTIFDITEADNRLKKTIKNEIKSLTWLYRLSPGRINLSPTAEIKEIQVFEVILKEKDLSREILTSLDSVIPHPVLFLLKYKDNLRYVMAKKERNEKYGKKMLVNSYYESLFYEEKELELDFFKFSNLQDVHDSIIEQLVPSEKAMYYNIGKLREFHEAMTYLRQEIKRLENEIKREEQFNKKVDISLELDKRKNEFSKFLDG